MKKINKIKYVMINYIIIILNRNTYMYVYIYYIEKILINFSSQQKNVTIQSLHSFIYISYF